MSSTALLLIAHGSRRDEANQQLEKIANRLQKRMANTNVQYAFMELAEPTIDEGVRRCIEGGAKEIVVIPFMLSPGRHVREDIPALVEEAANVHGAESYRVLMPLGEHDDILDVLVSIFDDARS
ncbi:MAG: CbiX/SirB N-terminal domain-containing protein [Polyangiales bacterium]